MDAVIIVLTIVIIALLVLRFFVTRHVKEPENSSNSSTIKKSNMDELMYDVKCIKVCMAFFVVMMFISLVVSLIVGINFFSVISKLK